MSRRGGKACVRARLSPPQLHLQPGKKSKRRLRQEEPPQPISFGHQEHLCILSKAVVGKHELRVFPLFSKSAWETKTLGRRQTWGEPPTTNDANRGGMDAVENSSDAEYSRHCGLSPTSPARSVPDSHTAPPRWPWSLPHDSSGLSR